MKLRHRRQNVLGMCVKFRKVTISLLDKGGDGKIGLAWSGEVKNPLRVVGREEEKEEEEEEEKKKNLRLTRVQCLISSKNLQ